MKSTAVKLVLTIVGMVLSVLLLRWTHWDGWFVTFLVAFLLSVLYGLDLGHELRQAKNPNLLQRLAGVVFGVPQALLGLVYIVTDGAIVIWVLYNSLVARLPTTLTVSIRSRHYADFLILWLRIDERRRPL